MAKIFKLSIAALLVGLIFGVMSYTASIEEADKEKPKITKTLIKGVRNKEKVLTWQYIKDDAVVFRIEDRDDDGTPDTYLVLEPNSEKTKLLAVVNADGIQSIKYFNADGDLYREEEYDKSFSDRTFPAQINLIKTYKDGQVVRLEKDVDGNGIPNSVEYFDADKKPVRLDRCHENGVIHERTYFMDGVKYLEETYTEKGFLKKRIFYDDGIECRIETDTDDDGKIDKSTTVSKDGTRGTPRKGKRD